MQSNTQILMQSFEIFIQSSWVEHGQQERELLSTRERALKNMAGEEGFDLEVEFSKFLAEMDKN